MSEDGAKYKVVPFKAKTGGDWKFSTYRSFWARRDMKLDHKALVMILQSYDDTMGNCCPTKKQLSRDSGLSEKTLNSKLILMKERGTIDWSYWRDRYGRERCRYILLCLQKKDQIQEKPPSVNY